MLGRGSTLQNAGEGPNSFSCRRSTHDWAAGFLAAPRVGTLPGNGPPGSSFCPSHTGGDRAQRGEGCSAPLGCPLPCPQATEVWPPSAPPPVARPSREFLLLLPLSRSDVSSRGCRCLIISLCQCGWLSHPRTASARGSEREEVPQARPGGRTRRRCTCSRSKVWARASRTTASLCPALPGQEGWIWGVLFVSDPQHPLGQGDLGSCALPGEAHPDLSPLLGS